MVCKCGFISSKVKGSVCEYNNCNAIIHEIGVDGVLQCTNGHFHRGYKLEVCSYNYIHSSKPILSNEEFNKKVSELLKAINR